jgi:hypothetical protein
MRGIPGDVKDPLEVKQYFETLLRAAMNEEQVAEEFWRVHEVVIHHRCADILERSEKIADLHLQVRDYEEVVGGDENNPQVRGGERSEKEWERS